MDIIIFIGEFNHRKGFQRLAQALDKLGEITSIFIGSGSGSPNCDGILYSGKVPHNRIANMLNTVDAFVLSTMNEECCNAIIEAMDGELPIMSSDRPFNNVTLYKAHSIRRDNGIDQIINSIKILQQNPQNRKVMASKSLLKSKKLNIHKRAKRITRFLEKVVTDGDL